MLSLRKSLNIVWSWTAGLGHLAVAKFEICPRRTDCLVPRLGELFHEVSLTVCVYIIETLDERKHNPLNDQNCLFIWSSFHLKSFFLNPFYSTGAHSFSCSVISVLLANVSHHALFNGQLFKTILSLVISFYLSNSLSKTSV